MGNCNSGDHIAEEHIQSNTYHTETTAEVPLWYGQ